MSKCRNRATVEGLSAAMDPSNAPTVRRRLWFAPPEASKPHAKVVFNRSNGRFRCECKRVHRWGLDCRALLCWCGWWHLRRDVEFKSWVPS